MGCEFEPLDLFKILFKLISSFLSSFAAQGFVELKNMIKFNKLIESYFVVIFEENHVKKEMKKILKDCFF